MNRENLIADSPQRFGLLRDRVQLVKKKDSDLYEITPIQEPLSFEKGFFLVIRACQLLARKNEGVIFVGVAGPSGAGKTVFTEKMLNFMPSIALISMDNYNDSSRLIDGNFDDPRLTDYDTLLENIHHLREGKPTEAPIYDFKTSCRIGYRKVEVPSSRIVIIEGIYALSEKLRPLLSLCVSVTGGVHFDLVKRVLRDIHRAGQEPEEIIHQISETVYPMYKAFIEPDLQKAHIKIINKFNPFSGFQNPTYILKSSRALTVDQVKAVMPKDYIESLEDMYDIYLLPPGEDPETCQSYLRMRNRDGKYSLMFEEWVTDSPFIISPRITFGVSVRLFGGLMALGYTIATILKRSSHTFTGNNVVIKVDWLEQLNRQYVQVQGRHRATVRDAAEQLGLEGSYIPHTYIEQIQLEKLVNDINLLPDDLKRKLSIDKDLLARSKEAAFRGSDNRADFRNRHHHSGASNSCSEHVGNKSCPELPAIAVTPAGSNEKRSETAAPNQGVANHLSEQISSMNERMDELKSQLKELNSKLTAGILSSNQQNLILQSEGSDHSIASMEAVPWFAGLTSTPQSTKQLLTTNEVDRNHSLASSSSSDLTCRHKVSIWMPSSTITTEFLRKQVTAIARTQCQILHLLHSVSNLVHQHFTEAKRSKRCKHGSWILNGNLFGNPVALAVATGGFCIFLMNCLSRS